MRADACASAPTPDRGGMHIHQASMDDTTHLERAATLTDELDRLCDEVELVASQRAAHLAAAYRSGASYDQLARRLRLSRETVRQVIRRHDAGRGQSGRDLRPGR